MLASGAAQTGLHIYVRNQRVARLDNPTTQSVLDWLARLDGEYVTKLILTNGHSWLTIDRADHDLSLCICNDKLEICSSEVISRQAVPNIVLRYLENKSL